MNENNKPAISDTTIDNIINSIYELYSNNHCLKKLVAKKNGDQTLIEAEFSIFRDINNCSFVLGSDNEIISSQCDCKWHKDYHTCAHIKIAYEYVLHVYKFPYAFEASYFKNIDDKVLCFNHHVKIRKLKEKSNASIHLLQEVQKQKIIYDQIDIQGRGYEIDPVLNLNSKNLSVSFRIGKEKKYYIKSLSEFLMNLEENKEKSYGNLLHFVQNEDCFTDFSKQVITFIRRYCCTKMSELEKQKSIPLHGKILDEFYNLLSSTNDGDIHFQLQSINQKFKIDVEKIDDLYIFSHIKEERYFFGEHYIYEIKQDKNTIIINKITSDDKGITTQFLESLEQDFLVVQKEDYPQFYEHILMHALPYIEITLPE